MAATPEKPLGRMTARKISTGARQARNIRLWDLDAQPGSTTEGLLKVYMGALSGIDRLEAKKAELANSAEFTPAGIQKQAIDFSFREIVPAFEKGRLAVQRARQEVASRRAKLVPPKSDPADMAAALRRQELRTLMRSMDDKGHAAFLKKNGRFEGLDPEIRQALIEMPASVSGIPESLRDGLLTESMQAQYGPELDQIAELERAIAITASALGETSEELRREAIAVDPAFADPDFYAARAAQAAGAAEALWLRKSEEGGQKVVRAMKLNSDGQLIWAKASEDDISNGLFAETRDEFEKLKSAAPIFGGDDGGRKARAAFVDEHGLDAYLNRNKIGEAT